MATRTYSPEQRAARKAACIRRREALLAAGLCTRCGRGHITDNRTYCDGCVADKNAQRKALNKRKKMEASKANPSILGPPKNPQCPSCGSKVPAWAIENGFCVECNPDLLAASEPTKVRGDAEVVWDKVGWCIECGHPVRWGKTQYCRLCLKSEVA